MEEPKDLKPKTGGENTQLALVLALFGLSLLASFVLCFGIFVGIPLEFTILLTAISSLAFWLTSIYFAYLNNADLICWEAIHQTLVVWRQAFREKDEKRKKNLDEQGKGAIFALQKSAADCPQVREVLQQLSERNKTETQDDEISYWLGVISAIDPFTFPSVRLAIWVQTFWQLWAIVAGVLAALVAWAEIEQLTLRALIYAASGGMLGASLYNLRTLADHIAVQRDYSTRFWVDYLTRPFLGAVLGVVVYAFAVGLAWTLTLQSPDSAQMPKVIFALGFLSGYALRSVLAWLSGIARTIFRPTPSPTESQSQPES
ncbi:MAG: hypothetical protein NZ805_14510 [Armatimonadetes bacterium]|nr:hypothetical protein [Armatimonadota bacterium]MDW8029970.1 hypothetical protein [Armatimonadota bacterium]